MRVGKRQKRESKLRYKNKLFITLFFTHVPAEKFEKLPQSDRYCLLLLGHIYDEISWLQRMSFISSRSISEQVEISNIANQMQTTMLARLLLGKLFEFKKVMSVEGSPIPMFITQNYQRGDEKVGEAQVKSIFDFYDNEKWIRVARNKHILHYPNIEDVAVTLEESGISWDFDVYHAMHFGNIFHRTSDVLANFSWFRLASPDEPMKGLSEALTIIRNLSHLTLQTLEQSIGNYIDVNLTPLRLHKKVKVNVSENVNNARLNYFMNMSPND